ncbi:MAG TPA: nickel pincer cofactor biosynthesis protein LarC [Planctomycetota bacterium]|nr:nickel pincer cofactor biosynthesis protein LarC [Planctomycetota bacterium]
MRVALLEPFAGVAGDMFVGALVGAGAPFARVRQGLRTLRLPVTVSCGTVERGGLRGRKFRVKSGEQHAHRGLKEILAILRRGKLPARALALATAAFARLAEAEAKVHGVPVGKVHFHEVGALDAICDIAGAALAMDALGIEGLWSRPLPLSTGLVTMEHGRLPVPAPATLELMKGRAVYDSGLSGELVTPTGAALVAAWAETSDPPAFAPSSIGYGAGDRDPHEYPNLCRVLVGETVARAGELSELVCDVDDATPQVLGHLLAALLEAGALDATLQPVVMKKGRPGTRVGVLARAETVPALEALLFREGTTLGVRRRRVERTELPRRIVSVRTRYGPVKVKVGELLGEAVHVAPEYEDCRALAAKANVPLREVIRAAVAAAAGERPARPRRVR